MMTGALRGVKTEQDRMAFTRALPAGARGEGRGARRVRGNRAGNVLVGALLHAGARLDEGLALTDLEQRLIDEVPKHVPVPELRAFGRAYAEARAAGPIATLPESVTRRPVDTGCTIAELEDELPALGREIMARPNVRVVGLGRLADDQPIDTDDHTAAVAAGSDTTARQSQTTREYGATSTGDWHTFDYAYREKTYLVDGTVDQHLTADIQCWEADDSGGGGYHKLYLTVNDL